MQLSKHDCAMFADWATKYKTNLMSSNFFDANSPKLLNAALVFWTLAAKIKQNIWKEIEDFSFKQKNTSCPIDDRIIYKEE